MAKKTIRIGIGTPEAPRSTLWSVTVGSSNVYIAQRFSHTLAKISLHDSGKWRFAVNSKNWANAEDRALFKWDRPKPVTGSVVLGPTIVFPPLLVDGFLKLPDQYNKKIYWLVPPTNEQERIVMSIFSNGKEEAEEYLKQAELKPDWSLSLPIRNNSRLNADTVTIISWIEKLRDFSKDQIKDVLAKMKIHFKKGGDPSGIFGVATPIYPGTEEERSRGLSPTIIEIILGKSNLEEDKI